VNNKSIYVLVKNFKGINQDVALFDTFREAQNAFLEYTGFSYSKDYQNPESRGYSEDFSETKIYEINFSKPLKTPKRAVSSRQLALPFNSSQ